MKNQLRLAAVCAAMMFTLSGCGYGTNYSIRYKEFFDYTFDREYSFDFSELTDDDGHSVRHRVFRLEYTDGYGEQRVNDKIDCYPYPKDKKELYPTKKSFYDSQLGEIVFDEMNTIAEEHFFAEYAEPYFGAAEENNSVSWQIDDHATGMIVFLTPIYLPEQNEKAEKIAYGYITPGTGWKVCDTTLESIMRDDKWSLIFSVRLDADADADGYVSKMKAMEAAFCENMGTPQNYQFLIKQRESEEEDNNKQNTVYYSGVMMGEAFDPEKSDENYSKTLYAGLLEKYGNS